MVFRTIEVEFDDVNPARAQRKGGASNHHSNQHACNEPPIHNEQGNTNQGQIFDKQQTLRRLDQPLMDQPRAQKKQNSAENIFRYITKEPGTDYQEYAVNSRNRQPRESTSRSGQMGERTAAQRGAAHVSADCCRQKIGDSKRSEVAFDVRFLASRDLY